MHEIRSRRIKHHWIRFFHERLWPLSHSWPLFFQTLAKKCRSCDDEGAYVLHKCALTLVFKENARRKYGREFSSVSVLTLSGTTCTARQLLVNTPTLVDTHGGGPEPTTRGWKRVKNPFHWTGSWKRYLLANFWIVASLLHCSHRLIDTILLPVYANLRHHSVILFSLLLFFFSFFFSYWNAMQLLNFLYTNCC